MKRKEPPCQPNHLRTPIAGVSLSPLTIEEIQYANSRMTELQAGHQRNAESGEQVYQHIQLYLVVILISDTERVGKESRSNSKDSKIFQR